ncbi:hypothetical protein QFZ40_001603 [Arthrobacter pascens]|uniref:hypothetical protein n=1 Tax=Arthrobacter pascens TaxID=1677 RepID=UPI002780DEF6|nr:hypothetical protein [Arthrobacter pascens]MDQ0633694.1 hypothetical protein [Arthrobacter pascens]
MDRLFPLALLRGHFKSLVLNEVWIVRLLVLGAVHGIPLLIGVWSWANGLDSKVLAPTLTAMSLLAGGALSAFSHLSTLRLKLTERQDITRKSEKPDRRMFDESATHLLSCAVGAMASAASLVGSIVLVGQNPRLEGFGAAWIGWIASLTFTLFWISVPRIYLSYVNINAVDSSINGTHHGVTVDD